MNKSAHGRLRILVVEDNGEIRKILCDLLKSSGYDVEVAADGEDGLALLKADQYNLLITDLGLPGMSGWDLAEASKRYQSDMAIVAISSWQGQNAVLRLAYFGISEVIWKPFRFDQIRTAIDKIFDPDRNKLSANRI